MAENKYFYKKEYNFKFKTDRNFYTGLQCAFVYGKIIIQIKKEGTLMGIDYGYTFYDNIGPGFVFGFYMIYIVAMLAISVGAYVLQSLGTYTIAKRRGIKHPWLSWIPVGSSWILGSISDQYRYVVKGQVKNKRKSLLILQIIMWIACIGFFAMWFSLVFQLVGMIYETGIDPSYMDASYFAELAGSVLGIIGLWLVMSGVAIAVTIIQYMALYDLYTSCEPGNNVLYLVLSIIFSITMPIFVFVCRNKDGGMPPRKAQPVVEQPSEPWEN